MISFKTRAALWRAAPFALMAAGLFSPTLLMAQSADLAMDAAGESAAPGFWSLLFSKGGLVTWVIALLSAVGLPIAAVKLYEFYRMDIFRPYGFEEALSDMRRGKTAGLAARLDALAHPAAPLIAFALSQSGGDRLTGSVLREELTRRAQFLVRHLSRHIWVLELIAASAPLFGLLGTVLGMIVAFQGVGQGVGGADTALLAAGIWEALLTTAFGLGVALPFSILAAVFNNAVDGVRDMVEDALTEILVRADNRNAARSEE
ncbi:MAG: Biopolymer transport protein ExbB [Alphaproteobacteria bacterium]|nr:MAG: Biopolymer transport protein ExbB [Alphaproteobacteria bacterium]